MTIEEYINQLVELSIERFKLSGLSYSEGKFREELIKSYPPVNLKWFNDNDIVELSKDEVASIVIGIDPTTINDWEKEKEYIKIYPEKNPKIIADKYRESLPRKNKQEIIQINIKIDKLTKSLQVELQDIVKQLNAAFPGDDLICRKAFLAFLRNYKNKYPNSLSHVTEWVFEGSQNYKQRKKNQSICKKEYITSCVELILEKLFIHNENAKVTMPLLVEAFSHASNIKVVKKNCKLNKKTEKKTDLVFNKNGREFNNFSYSSVETVIKESPTKITKRRDMGSKKNIDDIRVSLLKITKYSDFDSFKKTLLEN